MAVFKTAQGCVQSMPQNQLIVNSVMVGSPLCVQGLPQKHLRGISNLRDEAKSSSEMTEGSANEHCSFNWNGSPLWRLPYWKTLSANDSCSFNCRWQSPIEVAIFKTELHSEQGGELNFSTTPPKCYPECGPDVVCNRPSIHSYTSPEITHTMHRPTQTSCLGSLT